MIQTVSETPAATTETSIKQILRHGGVFGLGAVLVRVASVALLPVYTRVLSPADYGILAIVDLTSNLLAIVAGAGIASAAVRAHTANDTSAHHARVWWTALAVAVGTATLAFGPALLFRRGLTTVVFGANSEHLASLLVLGLVTTWVGSIAYVTDTYFRARKESWLVVGLSLFRLLLNIALNVTLLVWFRLGVAAVLYGNLVAAITTLAVQGYLFRRRNPTVMFDSAFAREYLRFGWPLAGAALLSVILHEADRYLLRGFSTLTQLGLYSVGYSIAQGISTLCILPFTSVWTVLVYEVGKSDTASQQYGRIFRHAALGTAWVLLAASLCARPLIYLLASPEYEHAADVIPVVCLAYWLYSLHEHFKTPILLHARTAAILPIYVVAGTVNVGLNLLWIPRFGAMGAAWASVVAFAVFSFGGFLLYRRIRRFEYPLRRCLALVGAMVATFIGVRTFALTSIAAEFIVGVIVSIVWFAMLFPALIGEGLSRLNRWKSQRNERAMSVHP